MPRLTPAISGGPRKASEPVVGRSEPIFRGVGVVVAEAGTVPASPAALVPPPEALGAGHAIPAAAAELDPDELGAGEPPQAVARRATPRLSTVSLATRGATRGSEVMYKLLDLKVRTAFDAKDQVFLIPLQASAIST
jgi:hypothetical protein